eukprot:c4795_g1_i1.p1 GENE.c4795_g1_i1~~c4795_g1_i1.p1  ORF type:complete len:233 (+),score=21.24 c4795_g1_i1:101-700(+)
MEDSNLSRIVRQVMLLSPCLSWKVVATALGTGKSVRQCRERWRNVLDPNLKRGAWTPTEDKTLCEMLARVGPKWAVLAEHLPGRTDTSVKNRFSALYRRDPGVRHVLAEHSAAASAQPQLPNDISKLNTSATEPTEHEMRESSDFDLPNELRGLCWTKPVDLTDASSTLPTITQLMQSSLAASARPTADFYLKQLVSDL